VPVEEIADRVQCAVKLFSRDRAQSCCLCSGRRGQAEDIVDAASLCVGEGDPGLPAGGRGRREGVIVGLLDRVRSSSSSPGPTLDENRGSLAANRTFKRLSVEQMTGRVVAAVPEGP